MPASEIATLPSRPGAAQRPVRNLRGRQSFQEADRRPVSERIGDAACQSGRCRSARYNGCRRRACLRIGDHLTRRSLTISERSTFRTICEPLRNETRRQRRASASSAERNAAHRSAIASNQTPQTTSQIKCFPTGKMQHSRHLPIRPSAVIACYAASAPDWTTLYAHFRNAAADDAHTRLGDLDFTFVVDDLGNLADETPPVTTGRRRIGFRVSRAWPCALRTKSAGSTRRPSAARTG